MNKKYRQRTSPKTRAGVAPTPATTARAAKDSELERLKQRLLLEHLRETPEPTFSAPIRRAANDAAALAWATSYPLLVLPVLLQEKAAAARCQALRQKRIRERSDQLAIPVA